MNHFDSLLVYSAELVQRKDEGGIEWKRKISMDNTGVYQWLQVIH